MKKLLLISVLFFIAFVPCSVIFGEHPNTISLQGRITDNSGYPISDTGTFTFTFSDGSNSQATRPILTYINRGLYTVYIDISELENIDFSSSVSVEVTYNDTNFGSTQLTASPYAFWAASSTYAANVGTATWANTAGIANSLVDGATATYSTWAISSTYTQNAATATYSTWAISSTYLTGQIDGTQIIDNREGTAYQIFVASSAWTANVGTATWANTAGIANSLVDGATATYSTWAISSTYTQNVATATYSTWAISSTYLTEQIDGTQIIDNREGTAYQIFVASSAWTANVGTATWANTAGIANSLVDGATATYSTWAISSTYVTSGGGDLAEIYASKENLEPGDVVVISQDIDNNIEKSKLPNSIKVAGVISTEPGLVLNSKEQGYNLALVGKVPVKVTNEGGQISRGDLLTTSSTPGHAKKASNSKPGSIIGKALENFNGSEGTILVLVNLQ